MSKPYPAGEQFARLSNEQIKRLNGRPAWWRDLLMCIDFEANYQTHFYVGSAAKLARALQHRFGKTYTEHAVRKVLQAFAKLGLVLRHGEHNIKAGVLKLYLVRSFQLGLVELMAHVKAMCIRVAYQGRIIGKKPSKTDPRIRVASQEITEKTSSSITERTTASGRQAGLLAALALRTKLRRRPA